MMSPRIAIAMPIAICSLDIGVFPEGKTFVSNFNRSNTYSAFLELGLFGMGP